MGKAKVAIVAGELRLPRFLTMFESLREAFDVTVYALDGERLLDRHGTGLKVRVFENISEMPGYLRGLEEELAGTDFILGFETSRLGTFQAVRAARKHGIPMGVVVTEHHPYFYERYANIRAIQFDICNKAERFWVTSKSAADTLKLDHVPKEAIRILGPAVDQSKFRSSPAGRDKFRSYVGIAPDEFVVLYHQELEAWNRPDTLIHALSLLNKRLGQRGLKVRALFAGSGQAAKDLKYKAFDLGLGKQIMFLHQDPESFIVDLYAASDVLLMPRPLLTEFHEEFPLPMLEAMATGLVPMTGAGSLAAELAEGASWMYADDSHQCLAAELQRLVSDRDLLRPLRDKGLERIRDRFSLAAVAGSLIGDIRDIIGSRVTGGAKRDTGQILALIQHDLSRGAEKDALLKIEEAMLLELLSASTKGELHRMRGDAHYGLGDMESAMQSYGEALRLNDRDHAAIRGLGFLSWQGHSNEEALVFFKRAISLREDDPETMLGIGLVFRRLGLNEEALFWLEKCVLSPVPPGAAIVALAQACSQIRNATMGIKVLERVLDAIGEHHTLMMTLGQLYLADGQTEEGNALLQKALAGGASPAA